MQQLERSLPQIVIGMGVAALEVWLLIKVHNDVMQATELRPAENPYASTSYVVAFGMTFFTCSGSCGAG